MAKFWAHGATISFNSIDIGGCTAIGVPDQSREEVELTAHDSLGWREFVDGLRDGGTCSITARMDPEDMGQIELIQNFNARNVAGEVVITLPIDSPVYTISFDAFVLDTGGSLPFDDAAEVTYTLRIKREVTFSWVSV
jgi:hypothetical protein